MGVINQKRAIETLLDKKGIKYQVNEIIGSKTIICDNGIRIHIYKEQVSISDRYGLHSLPITEDTFKIIEQLIKESINGSNR